MIDPLKATKGRRMSKKTRKKTAKAPTGKTARGESGKSTKSSAKASTKASTKPSAPRSTAAKARRTAANKPGKARKSANSPTPAAAGKARTTKAAAGNPSASQSQRQNAAASVSGKSALAEGAMAPGFTLPRDGGETVSLADFSGRKLVLFFYPRADTPGCTREAIDFTRLQGQFAESRTAVLGVSADPPRAQEAFRDKHELSIPLVSDEQHEMLDAYGVWGEKSMYGRTFQGILRTTVLIGADGRVIKIWRHVKVDGHADEVLAAAQSA
jgi:thioredoxin-dependent peroxiredoxin